MENPALTLRNRLTNLSTGEKRLIKGFINAYEDAIRYQNLEIEHIPDSNHLPVENDKIEAVNDRLIIIKAYENRSTGDYDDFAEFNRDDVLELFEEMKGFYDKICGII